MFRLALVGVVGVLAAAGGSDVAPPPRPVDVAALVRQLGGEDFADREAALRRLSTLNVGQVPPELLAALKSPDPEVRDRAAKAVKALRDRIALMPLPRPERFARRGQVDLYVASTAVGDYKADDPQLWEPALEIGREAVVRADKVRGRPTQSSGPVRYEGLAAYKESVSPRFMRAETVYEKGRDESAGIHAPGIRDHAGFGYSAVVSRGPVGTGSSQHSLILATGDFDCGGNVSCSTVICDGDVRVKENVSYSVIVTRGDISVKGWAGQSTLVAGGKITIGTPPEQVSPVALPDRERELDRREKWQNRVIVEEKAVRPLGYVTFFELSTVGVEAKLADAAVKVVAVADGKPFAKAGVTVGDVITAVNGTKPESAEALRRLLRDALAVGDATVTVRRGDKTETLTVALPE